MIKTGIDIVKIKRIKRLADDSSFVEKVFDEIELDNNIKSLAGIFALKEAFFKATQIKIKKWKEIIVKNHENGKPYLVFDKNLLDIKVESIDCSVSHDGEYAIASVVIIEK